MTLPAPFEEQTRALLGAERYERLRAGLTEQPSPVSIRLNPLKGLVEKAEVPLADGLVPWCAEGRYLRERPPFTFDPMLHAGAYYVQEASSMFLDHLLRAHLDRQPAPPDGRLVALDLCAAPGGKSTLARTALPDGSLLVCNEPVRQRASVLAENMQKWGHPHVVVTNNLPHEFQKTGLLFDVVICDVPCSGEGMFRKDEGARTEWSPQQVQKCWRLQRDIVAAIWPCLKPGGLLVYSTCTFNQLENEDNVAWIMDELGASLLPDTAPADWSLTPALAPSLRERAKGKAVYRFLPGLTRGEGLFMAALSKPGEPSGEPRKGPGRKERKEKKGGGPVPREWLLHADNYVLRSAGGPSGQETRRAIPRLWADLYDALACRLHVLHAGVALGQLKGRDLVPDPSLALSTQLDRRAFPSVEVDRAEALRYLRKEALTLPAGVPRGWVLLCYGGLPLGFVKNLGNRANNLYPAEWKIKSTHIPDYETILRFA